MGYRTLSHTADLGMSAWGVDLGEALAEAARGLCRIKVAARGIRPESEKALEARGFDREELLVSWLNEVLYLMEGEGMALAAVDVDSCSDTRVSGRAFGEQFDPSRHMAGAAVKAVTWHEVEVRETPGRVYCRVYFDL